jgi:hypothetical protein
MVLVDENVSSYLILWLSVDFPNKLNNKVLYSQFNILSYLEILHWKDHASIREQLLYMFESKIEEGEVYQMP